MSPEGDDHAHEDDNEAAMKQALVMYDAEDSNLVT